MGLLDGKICLVTGAGRGIGAAITTRFVEEGAIVYANARSQTNLEHLCERLEFQFPGKIRPLLFDVCDEMASKQAVMKIKRESERLDVLVNNAGIMRDALIGMVSRELMQSIFETNVFAVMNMLQLATKLMSKQKRGSIVNISSIVGLQGNPGQLVYSASKGAVAALTKTAAKELADKGIRVNAVAPGMIDTDMFRSIGPEKVNEMTSAIRMGRLGTPEEVADAIVFLASDLSRYITGEIIGVNGGAIV